MCGRYASARKRIELLEEFSVERDKVAEPLAPDYNVAPTKPVYAVLSRPRRSDRDGDARADNARADNARADSARADSARAENGRDDARTEDGDHRKAERQLRVLRWGLVPFWAKDVKIGSRMINARAETVAEKPAFRRAFAQRRCLLPADGYYEWQKVPGAAKQPMFITRSDGRSLAFAGLYELWRDPAVPDEDAEAMLWTATIITTTAQDELGAIHDRMPMIIDPASWADWLDPANSDASDVRALLTPAAVSGLTTYAVSTAVNSVRNNGPQLIEPTDPGLVAQLAEAARADGPEGGQILGKGGNGALF
jgi:putative SOS response-associated peptidase YedK